MLKLTKSRKMDPRIAIFHNNPLEPDPEPIVLTLKSNITIVNDTPHIANIEPSTVVNIEPLKVNIELETLILNLQTQIMNFL